MPATETLAGVLRCCILGSAYVARKNLHQIRPVKGENSVANPQ